MFLCFHLNFKHENTRTCTFPCKILLLLIEVGSCYTLIEVGSCYTLIEVGSCYTLIEVGSCCS